MHIDDLPTEILVHIFDEAMSDPPFAIGGTTLTLSISQVCGTWRSIALESTALWRDIRISAKSSLYKLSQLLARSKESLVSISIDCTAQTTSLSHCWELLKGVVAHRVRICALDIIAPLHILSILAHTIIHVGRDFPCLRRLRVVQKFSPHLGPEENVMNRVPTWRLNLDSPQLQSLSITAITPTNHSQFNPLKELQIKESGYFVQSLGEDESRGTPSAHFAELQILSIICSPLPTLPSVYPTDTHIVSFTLSNLRTADIPRGTLARFLSVLHMPSLQHLVIQSLFGYLWDEFVCWLTNAQYPTLCSVAFESLDLIGLDAQCLGAFASVSTLRLIEVDSQHVVRVLESNPLICPRVQAIDVGVNGTAGYFTAIAEFAGNPVPHRFAQCTVSRSSTLLPTIQMNSAADIRSRIAEIEHSIAGIESQLASLRADKEQLQLTLSSIVYRVLTVPPEIIRSGGLPLDLRITFSTNETDTVWSALTAHSTQWRNMELLTLDSVVLSLEALPSSILLLQRLVIKGDVTLEEADNGHPVSTPELRELNLDIPFVMYQLALPLSGITTLSLSGSSAAGISQILTFTPDLEVLAISIYDDFEQYPVPTPCSLTRLHTLHCHAMIPPHVLDQLYAPALTHLVFDGFPDHNGGTAAGDAMQALIARSRCAIRSLEVLRVSPNESAFIWARRLPTLTDITLEVSRWTPELLSTFCQAMTTLDGGGLLPELEGLTLRRCTRIMNPEPLVSMLTRRWRWVDGLSRIKTFALSLEGPDLKEYLMDGLPKAPGLEFVITSHAGSLVGSMESMVLEDELEDEVGI
ncbi:hypothetical protein B0H19DRAFT_1070814 [Mycena capillaripes]|nr:hypothetical protein B0H19DRAFT_1070814 [Mycena capillaripes]